MTNEEKDIEFIERFLDKKLSSEEIDDFHKRLEVDTNFASLYAELKGLIAGIRYSGRKSLFQKLKKVEASISIEESYNKKIFNLPTRIFYSYSAAATILLLITFTFIFLIRHQSTPEEIFSENFDPYQNIVESTTRGDIDIQSTKKRAFYLYDMKNYVEAVELFKEVLPEEKDSSVIMFYIGNSYLALGEYNLATSAFGNVLKKHSVGYKVQSEWYLALSLLAEGKINLAKKHLVNMKNNGTTYSNKAEQILEALN